MALQAPPPSGPVKRAFIRKRRANSSIRAASVGGIHEGLNASDVIAYPYVVFGLAFSPLERAWGSLLFIVGFDVIARGFNPVEVSDLDVLIAKELHDSTLLVTGLSTLTVSRAAELPLSPERTAEGRKLFQNGGTYEVWLDQNRMGP